MAKKALLPPVMAKKGPSSPLPRFWKRGIILSTGGTYVRRGDNFDCSLLLAKHAIGS